MPNLGIGLGLPKTVNITNNPILNRIGGSVVAYSLRKISASATKAIRVRRDNDHEEQDIGFVGRDLDTVSLLSFVGSNNGFVTTWYDQSGNGNDATQSTADNQPRIVNAGVVEVDDYGRPTIAGVSANSTQLVTGAVFSYTQLHAFVVGKFSADQTAFFQFGSTNTNGNLFTFSSNTVSARTSLSPETVASISVATCKTTSNIYSVSYETDLRQIYANGVKGTDGTGSSTLNVTNSALTLLSRNGSYCNEGFNSEFIFFTSILTDTQRQKLEQNQSKYYGITLA